MGILLRCFFASIYKLRVGLYVYTRKCSWLLEVARAEKLGVDTKPGQSGENIYAKKIPSVCGRDFLFLVRLC